jgi:hypothetical protein
VQQIASRGVSKATIESLYDGAQVLNCIGAVATIYQADVQLSKNGLATQITVSVVREVRINARKGLTREVADYSAVLAAFSTVVESEPGGETLLRGYEIQPRTGSPTPTQLEAYLTRLGGCVTSKKASQSGAEK